MLQKRKHLIFLGWGTASPLVPRGSEWWPGLPVTQGAGGREKGTSPCCSQLCMAGCGQCSWGDWVPMEARLLVWGGAARGVCVCVCLEGQLDVCVCQRHLWATAGGPDGSWQMAGVEWAASSSRELGFYWSPVTGLWPPEGGFPRSRRRVGSPGLRDKHWLEGQSHHQKQS